MDEENLEQSENGNESEEEQNEKKEIGDYLFSWKRKFDNFWYHYKIPFIFGVLILIFIIFCISQCAAKVKGDANIAYIGSQEIDSEWYGDLNNALTEILSEDLNGDGKISSDFTHFLYMTGVQAENMRAGGNPVDYQSLMTTQTQIQLELATGNIVIYFINPEVYKELSAPGLFMPLEDALGYVPEKSNDVYSIRLGSLPCWDYYTGLHNFPGNTLLVARDLQVSEEDDETMTERYKRNMIMFKRLVEFTFGDDENDTEK